MRSNSNEEENPSYKYMHKVTLNNKRKENLGLPNVHLFDEGIIDDVRAHCCTGSIHPTTLRIDKKYGTGSAYITITVYRQCNLVHNSKFFWTFHSLRLGTKKGRRKFWELKLWGSLGKAKHWKKNFIFIFLVLILPKYSESARKCFNFWHIYYIRKS